ncbi:MAG: AMP-binding protein [Gammaproteobacteria bacterium]|nr:AMP-binding protein [Gammaproteobacteria bacterium]
MNLSQLVADRAKQYKDKPFLLFERQPVTATSATSAIALFQQTLTFQELDDRVNQACHYLSGLGLSRGDVFNLHLPNCPGFIILWFAAARLGAVMMPTNVLSSAAELAYLIDHSNSTVSFTTADHLTALRQCQREGGCLKSIILCDPYTDTPDEKSFEAQLPAQALTPWNNPVSDTDMVAIMYTSGTTSKPKGVMVSHANYLTAGQTVADAVELGEHDRQFVVLPLFHGNAQYYSIMSALLRGASAALMDRFSASRYFDRCIEYNCTVASLFAAPMRMILAQQNNPAQRDNRLRIVIYAQNLTGQQMQDWQRRFDAPLAQIWGMTETMGPPLMNPLHGERRNWTVGKPSGNYEIALVDESGKSVKTGQEGEIIVKGIPGRTIMAGYFKNPLATAETIRDNWLHTGDNAVRDEEGFYRFVDRKKDMIKRSGENISAGEVENVLLQHPAVFECAVIGLPDAIRDESIVAVVVPKQGQSVEADTLIEFCADRLASFRVPQQVVFSETLPKTSVGKIQKHLIRDGLMAAPSIPSPI